MKSTIGPSNTRPYNNVTKLPGRAHCVVEYVTYLCVTMLLLSLAFLGSALLANAQAPPGSAYRTAACPNDPDGACFPGSFSQGGWTWCCTLCRAGTFQDLTGQIACKPCEAGTASPDVGRSSACPVCPPGTWSSPGSTACAPCSPGTYSLGSAAVCSLCQAGTFGSSAGLATAACSGVCPSCAAGSTTAAALSCASTGARAAPPSLGLLAWPAAHPLNPKHVDLIVAPRAACVSLTSAAACDEAATIAGVDGTLRYVVGTAAAMHLEAAEVLACTAQ